MKSLKESLFDSDIVSKDIKFTFAGLEINPMPVIYKHGKFQFAKSWDQLSYKKKFGLKEGSTYFNWHQCDGINIKGWRLPTEKEWQKILARRLHYPIEIDEEEGWLFYPDNYPLEINPEITTKDQLKECIEHGCIFLHATSCHYKDIHSQHWGYISHGYGCYWTSTTRVCAGEVKEDDAIAMYFNTRNVSFSLGYGNKLINYYPIILVK